MTPTARTLKDLRDNGWTADVVERWLPRAFVRKDLFGCIDILAINEHETLGVQATAASCAAARMKKAIAEPRLKTWLAQGGRKFAVVGWSKRGPRGKRKTWQPVWRWVQSSDLTA